MMLALTKAGRYEILGELGRGAMGVVYKATDPVIGRTVAVKTLKLSEEGTGLSRTELLSRFQTEARAAGLLTHPNIVVVFDAGEEEGLFYITMELVEGKSLQAQIDAGQMFPLARVLRIMEQTCNALQFAHERNIVHRDIKPANLMLTGDDTVKVTDFGTAKILQFGTVQQTAHVMGTPSYMSPEQVKGKVVDGRSDIFSLGVMLYELATGEKPFPGQNITTVIYKIVNEDPVSPRTIDPSIHPGLSAVILKALAKDPEQRYQTCKEMLEDLRNYRNLDLSAAPNSTIALPRPESTVALPLGRNPRPEDAAHANAARSLAARASHPMQTPALRRTGTIAPLEEPKRKNHFLTVFFALLLVGVIIFGAKKIRPEFEAARQQDAVQKNVPASVTAEPEQRTAGTQASAENSTESAALPSNDGSNVVAEPAAAVSKTPVNSSNATPAKKPEIVLSAAAAEFKGRIEEAAAERNLSSKLKIAGNGNSLTLSGKLLPSEHASLLAFLRKAPPEVQIVDHLQYEDVPVEAARDAETAGHPVATAGRSAIHVVTNIVGATAAISGNGAAQQCDTPCSFGELQPGTYNLQVKKAGFQPVQTTLQVRSGQVLDQKLTLEALGFGLQVVSRPAGADVFINGAKQPGQTPVLLPLAPGQYNLVIRLSGYDAYSGPVQVKDNVQSQVDVELKERDKHVAWAQVDSQPAGAQIFVDGVDTGRTAPARVEIPAGIHTIVLKLEGYSNYRHSVQASEGGTVNVSGVFKR